MDTSDEALRTPREVRRTGCTENFGRGPTHIIPQFYREGPKKRGGPRYWA